MNTRLSFACAICAAVLLSATANAQTISLEADYWMPFNGDGKAESGYMIDIAKAVFEPKGFQVTYSVTPWARAVADVRAGKCSAVVAAGVDDAPDLVFPKEEQGLGDQTFYVKAGSPWKYAGVGSLKGLKLAVIKDYTYFPDLDSYIKANPTSVVVGFGEGPLEDNLRLLVDGSVDVVVDATAVLAYTVNVMGIKNKIAIAGNGGSPMEMYIAFSPKDPKSKEYANMLSTGTAALRKSGQLMRILAKYGLSDWK
jgi:polar amino acid transport system substrate-binding protein